MFFKLFEANNCCSIKKILSFVFEGKKEFANIPLDQRPAYAWNEKPAEFSLSWTHRRRSNIYNKKKKKKNYLPVRNSVAPAVKHLLNAKQ
ncbi:hypothetical protein TNIN_153811 [Trichonephila inaurata madagascariensis]|uniref:Uncharacterized protein n=1 Tax=Trichonephila inaurata madagascariensis TaxID=2747483 RepID=A0A8X6X1U0_9ARAC|nr:hypothetical protein TNIN_153811 [Trichonephila inaurata madagascariensis]